MLTAAIGDIHGCLDKLERLHKECRRFAGIRPLRFIFLGDLIDRGPNSRAVVQTIMDMQRADPANVIILAGNHEDFLHNIDDPIGIATWLRNGGDQTLNSYGISDPADFPPDRLDFLRGLPSHYDDGVRFFVHAGIRPGVPLDRQTRHDLLWIREPFLGATDDYGRLIVHGHSPRHDGKPEILPNRVNLDTAAVYGGPLTAAVFVDGERMPVDFLQA